MRRDNFTMPIGFAEMLNQTIVSHEAQIYGRAAA